MIVWFVQFGAHLKVFQFTFLTHQLAPPPARTEPFSIKGSFRRSACSIEEVGELRIRLKLTRVLLQLGFTSQALKITKCSFKRSSLGAQRQISHSGVWQGFRLTQALTQSLL